MDIRISERILQTPPRVYVLFFGLLMAITFATIWTAGALTDGKWVFGVNMISDLGVSETIAHYIFGWGCIITGFSGSICFLLMSRCTDEKFGRIIFYVMSVAAVMLVFVGIFNEHTPYHTPPAVALFVLAWIAMIASTIRDFFVGDRLMCVVNGIFAVFVPISLALMPLPLFEAVAVICLLIWVPILSFAAYRGVKGYGDAE